MSSIVGEPKKCVPYTYTSVFRVLTLLFLFFFQRRYDVANGIQAFQVSWISKASASQRAGRAGRTGPGHCYRLYSSALFEHHFDAFAQPEILRMPIEGVVLQMKAMHIDAVVNFPFPTSPNRDTLAKAETTLTYLGALGTRTSIPKGTSEVFVGTIGGQITDLGKAMSLFPLSPRFSRMLVSGQQHGCLPYVISIFSALSVGDPFLRQEVLGDEENEEADDVDGKLSHINSAAVKAKEAQRIQRKAFFNSQHVSETDYTTTIVSGSNGPSRCIHPWEILPAMCSGFFLWSGHMNTLAVVSNSVLTISFGPK